MIKYELKPGDKVRTIDGTVVEILNETQDGQWILVRYIERDRAWHNGVVTLGSVFYGGPNPQLRADWHRAHVS
jgi:hypothetical protein